MTLLIILFVIFWLSGFFGWFLETESDWDTDADVIGRIILGLIAWPLLWFVQILDDI